MADNENPVEVAADALRAYLQAQLPEVQGFIDDFPNPNETLTYPTIAVTHEADDGAYTTLQPYQDSIGPAQLDNTATEIVIVGEWDFKIMLDFWTRNKVERGKLFSHFYSGFNADIEPMGLRLQLANHFNVWASYDLAGFKHVDGEQASQRREWRTIVTLLVHVKQAMSRVVPIITKPLESGLEIVNTI